MSVLVLHFLTIPTLGLIKNLIKYKNATPIIFLRTPAINMLIYNILTYYNEYRFKNYNKIAILKSILYERYFFFIYKIIYAWYTDNYNKKKEKYQKKYGLEYT